MHSSHCRSLAEEEKLLASLLDPDDNLYSAVRRPRRMVLHEYRGEVFTKWDHNRGCHRR